MTRIALLLTSVAIAGFIACQGCEPKPQATAPPAPSAPTVTQTPAPAADVKVLQAAADRLEAAAKARPTDVALKGKAADADYQAGHAIMVSDQLDRKVKYRVALRYFRRALALNPAHGAAAEEKSLIESIYRQMGRAIPQS